MISIIVPVYNRIEALKRTLDSIAKQTYKDVEVIIIDDGSDDNFQFSIFNFQTEMNIKFIKQEHAGAPAARNRGLTEAKGEYVIFWDADVIGEPLMLERMLDKLEKNPDASYCYSNFQFSIFAPKAHPPMADNFQTIFNFSIFKKKIHSQSFDLSALRENNYIHSTSLIRLKDVVEWDESLKRFQDWDLWLTMAESGKSGVWIDEYLFTVESGGTMSKWLPRLAYKAPFKWLPFVSKSVVEYETAKKMVLRKHGILSTPPS